MVGGKGSRGADGFLSKKTEWYAVSSRVYRAQA